MDLKKLIKLDKEHIEKIKKFSESKIFATNSPLFYEGQTPVVAFLILDGSVNLTKNRKIKSTVRTGGLLGLKELMSNSPSSVSAEALPHTSVCFLDKSTVLEILKSQENDLSLLFKNICELHAS
jgi:CRP-like cAMP-binding protein